MAEHPELWKDRTPESRPLFDHKHSFGVAREAERAREAIASSSGLQQSNGHRQGVAFPALHRPWANGEGRLSNFWHRVKCRSGRHEIQGGHSIQIGSDLVFFPRRCRWCDTGWL